MLLVMKILFWSLWVSDLPKVIFIPLYCFSPAVNSAIISLLSTEFTDVAMIIYIKASPLRFAFSFISSTESPMIYTTGEPERL